MSDDRQVTYSHEVVTLPEATSRDANNVERTWRRHKAWWLITHGQAKLERLLGRSVAGRHGDTRHG